ILAFGVCAAPGRAYDVNDSFSVSGIAVAGLQCQDLDTGGPDSCKDGHPFQVEIAINDAGRHTVFAKLGFAAENGLGPVSPFALSPWAADLHDDLRDINGRGRDHLLTAWYRHRRVLPGGTSIAVTLGLIDATDYLDDNAFANDEYTQFMNEAFVNAPTAFLPSYDWGGVFEVEHGPWALRLVQMRVGENDDGAGYSFTGGQLSYTRQTRLGEGTYRVIVAGTSDDFLDPRGARRRSLAQLTLSADQELGETLGAFLRLGWQDDDAAVTHAALYSGGLTLKGGAWGRPGDGIGIGYAQLDGGNSGVSRSHVGEVYYRAAFGEHWALTGDVQFVKDDRAGGAGRKGRIYSLRATKEF
ncbi:MAG: porin, partial [Alphaproteobacteria bacterium]